MHPQPPASPAQVTWAALAAGTLPLTGPSACAACAGPGGSIPIPTLVSSNFTDWDRLGRDEPLACPACAWAFRNPALRTRAACIVSGHASLQHPVGLLATPFAPGTSATAPITGRKHLLPYARWGAVTTDAGTLPWGEPEAAAYRAVAALLAAGVPEPAVRSAAVPPASAFTSDPEATLAHWETARDWRGTPHLDLALRTARYRPGPR